MHETQLTGDDILPYETGHKYNCLFCSIAIKQDYRNCHVLTLLLEAMNQKLVSLKSRNIEISKILADCVTDKGIKLVSKLFSRLGFKHICTHEGGEIYEFNGNLLDLL